jgi:hypothetical protein
MRIRELKTLYTEEAERKRQFGLAGKGCEEEKHELEIREMTKGTRKTRCTELK